MVTEIRKRASNKSTEQASVDIANFLAAASNEHASRGWILLNCLLLLAAGDQVGLLTKWFLLLWRFALTQFV